MTSVSRFLHCQPNATRFAPFTIDGVDKRHSYVQTTTQYKWGCNIPVSTVAPVQGAPFAVGVGLVHVRVRVDTPRT